MTSCQHKTRAAASPQRLAAWDAHRREVRLVDGAEHLCCARCTAWLPRPAYEVQRAYNGVLRASSYCRPCTRAHRRAWYQANRDDVRAAQNQAKRDAYRLRQGLPVDAALKRGRKPRGAEATTREESGR